MAGLLGSPFCETRLCRSGLSAVKILERFTNRMVVPSEHHSLRPARSRRGRSETSVPCLIAAARCDSFPPELSHRGRPHPHSDRSGQEQAALNPPSAVLLCARPIPLTLCPGHAQFLLFHGLEKLSKRRFGQNPVKLRSVIVDHTNIFDNHVDYLPISIRVLEPVI